VLEKYEHLGLKTFRIKKLSKFAFIALILSYPTALAMIASGKVDVKRLITHHFTLEESLKAFETARDGTGGAIKVMIHP